MIKVKKIKKKKNSTISKRFKVLNKKEGKLKRLHSHSSHLKRKKTSKQKINLRKSSLLHPSDWRRIKKMI